MAEVVPTQILMREMMTNGEQITAANPLSVSSVFVAGEVHLGDVGGAYNTSLANISLGVTGTYATGDYVGPSGTATEFTGAVRVAGDSGIIASAMIIDRDKQSLTLELWLFDATVTPPDNNAAWSLSDVDVAKCIGVISFSTWYASALNSVSIVTGAAIGFEAAGGSTSIWGCLVARGAPTYTASGLTVKLSILQD